MRILDSDHCIGILRGKLDLSRRSIPGETLATTTISVGELIVGARKSVLPEVSLRQVDLLLQHLVILPFDEASGRLYGALRADLEIAGRRLADLDLQIASIAISNGAPLLTHNRRHFGRIPGLVLEDWLA